ncbi:hypothetical protein QNI16_08760 [Cytophagaceae bacterium YF14B1]|uniref:Adhesin domain-containing protein n=1 Tax=Xanthocytophaga flava TaxID=3048013 RepID=A0AAE3U7W9_9BACT|nr:DUF4097 family beta strand repeat-containing protein [Xanthocytophaga flavus]MDJ1480573.1 hypothetical protein [Xanthocytophaga flavus]
MKKFIIILTLLVSPILSYAQDFKFEVKSANKVKIGTIHGHITVEGHTGKDIIVTGNKCMTNEEGTEGLKLISGDGVSDNTNGYCLNIQESNGTVVVRGVSNKNHNVKILIPEKMNIIIQSSGWSAKDITINNFKSELEIKSEYASVAMANVTGPVVLNATYGKVKAVFDKINQDRPISIVATYNNLDVTLPSDTKANLRLESSYGDIYTDFDVKSSSPSSSEDDLEKISSHTVTGSINGGGVEVHLESPYKNVFLRKKK